MSNISDFIYLYDTTEIIKNFTNMLIDFKLIYAMCDYTVYYNKGLLM